MTHTFDIRVSQRDADRALRRFILRGAGIGTLVAVFVCLSYVALDVMNDGIGLFGIVIVTLLILLLLVYVRVFFIRRKQTWELLDRLGDSPVTYRLSDVELSTKSTLGSSTLKWEMIKKIWVDPDLVMVFYTGNGYTTIPTSQIPGEALRFLISKVGEDPGKIIDRRPRGKRSVAADPPEDRNSNVKSEK